jgi:O-antigen biosynthesis protein WbqP
VRPGITGPAQLAGIDMSTPVELAEADAVYIVRINFLDDLRYIIRTALGRGSGDAVKRD